jgi:hypothetical protein
MDADGRVRPGHCFGPPREGFQVQVKGRLAALIGGDRFAHALYIAGDAW